MPAKPHVIVLGLGIAGSSIAATLASRGFHVTAIEQFSPLHERGSSHGDTRIYRRVPHEGEVYVQMAAASYDGWKTWNQQAGEALFLECGSIDAGPGSSPMVQSAERLCAQYDQPYTVMRGDSFNRRHPHFALPSGWRVVYQPKSGIVRPDATRSFLHARARESGAKLIFNTPVLGIDYSPNAVTVATAEQTYQCDYLIVAAGSWLTRLLPELGLSLRTERRVLAWHQSLAHEDLTDGRLPAFVLDAGGGWYGMPTPGGRIKIGHDKHLQQQVDPTQPSIAPNAEDAVWLAGIMPFLRGFAPQPDEMKPCIYTITGDHNFIIDHHPAHANVLLFSCCSGHGFKFAPVYGEIAADMLAGNPRPDLASLRMSRIPARVTRFGN
jgi:sarcosine oxidase